MTRVLLIDDDEDEWLITRDLLREVDHHGRNRSAGALPMSRSAAPRFRLDWVATYEAGLAAMKRAEHDIYLIDYRLGARSGLDLLREASALGVRAPLILLTGQGDPDVDAAATQAGAADYLVKDGLDAALLERAIRYSVAQKRAQEALRQAALQNERLSAAIENAELGVMIAEAQDGELRINYVNAAFETISGYAWPEVRGRDLFFLARRETEVEAASEAQTAREIAQEMARAIAAGQPYEGVALSFRRDGTPFWNATQISPVLDPGGHATTWIGFIRDVSERIEADRALRESQRNLAAAQRLTHLGSWAAELDWNTPSGIPTFDEAQWSDEVFRILGFEPGAVRPSRALYLSLVHPDDLEVGSTVLETLMQSVIYDRIYRIVRLSGEERVLHVRAELDGATPNGATPDGATPDGGRARRVIGTLHDVTKRARTEHLARQSQERLQSVVENAPLLIWSLDCAGIIQFIQGRALQALGLRSEALVGTSVFDARVPALLVPPQMKAQTSIAEESEAKACDLNGSSVGSSAGSHVGALIEVQGMWFETTFSALRDASGQPAGIVGVATDVTERVRAKRLLDESEARLSRIVANVPGMVYRFHRTPNGEMTFSEMSEGCREIYGVEAAEVLRDAQVLIEVAHPDDAERFFDSVVESERTLKPWQWEGRILHRNGETRWIRGQARPERQSDGSTTWDGLVVDITQSRRVQEELLHSRDAFNEAQKLASLGSYEWDLATGEVKWSDQMFRLLGYEPQAFTPTYASILEFIDPDERHEVQRQAQISIEQAMDAAFLVKIRRRDGNLRVWQLRSRIETDAAGRSIKSLGSVQDVTESLEAERALRESEQRYALAAQGANDGLWDWNLENGQIYLSPRWKMMIGHDLDDIGADPEEWLGRVHPDDIDHLRSSLALHLSGESPHFECQYRLRCCDGSYAWMLGRGLAVTGEDGVAHRIAGSQTDISQRKMAEAQLSRNAFYDALTGLPNRALFLDRLERTLARARRQPDYRFATLFLDIDRFKKINDSLGHIPGDQLLIQAAARFEKCLRPGDTVARLGGDEFAILLDDVGDSDAIDQVAGRIQKELEVPFSLQGREVFVTVSIGIALCQGGQERPDELLRNADTAMYRAKSLGRARHETFDATMHQRAVKMLELESDLWRAVERDELRLFFQPIIALGDGRICGFEALVRWQHPERGLVSPGDFIPLAEETGLIVPIGWWVLEQACRQAQAWRAHSPSAPYFMSVNLSSKQFSQTDLIERVRGIVEVSGFDPRLLKLELTESVIMENTDSAATMLLQLKAMGIRLSMDDFGTGYSSLSYLHRFSLDTLKIDRSFVSQMNVHAQNQQIIGTIVSLANGLSMNVVAEGVETAEQLHDLRALGCGYAQGFHFSRPLPAGEIEALLGQNLKW